jgi:DivIVA domain-containing protein
MTSVEFTSDAVRNTKFRDKMRGYHPDEVDAFLERTAVAIEQLQNRLADVTERALRAEVALESNSEADESIRRTLTLAQRTAELAVKEANADAERIRAEAIAAAERDRAEADETCTRLVSEATARAESLRADADEAFAAASAAAATVMADAEREAEERRRATDEAISDAERDSAERIAAAQREADEAWAAKAETARRELEADVSTLSAQRSELRAQVEALGTYLAQQRSRVLEVLMSATAEFEASLTPAAEPALVAAALAAERSPEPAAEAVATAIGDEAPATATDDDLESEGRAVPREESAPAPFWSPWNPVTPPARDPDLPAPTAVDLGISNEDAVEPDGPAAVWFPAAVSEATSQAEVVEAAETTEPATDDPVSTPGDPPAGEEPSELGAPSTLLFTLEDEMRREAEQEDGPAADAKPRKTLLGRRRG